MISVWFATFNSSKVKEFKSLSAGLPLELHTPSELSFYSSPEETGDTFLENAKIKAVSFQKTLGARSEQAWVVSEDSGLEVDGLGGLPGVHSARYAGDKASDAENNSKLLKMLKIRSPKNRRARFRCCLVAIGPDAKEYVFEGSVEGEIAQRLQGQGGFGYDPLFIPEGETKTFSELGSAFKNKVSHRSQAVRAFLDHLRTTL